MFVRYPPSHACNVYRMLNMSTRHVIKSRDIKWLHKTYEDWCVKEDPESEKDDEIDDDDSILANTKAKETVEQDKKKDKGSKVIREMKKLQGWFNPDASRVIESSDSGREPIVDPADTAFMMVEQPQEPGTFDEAFNHPEEDVRLIWREAIHKEFKEMNLRGVWKKVNKEEMPVGRRCVKSKWVFKVKRNGVFRARLVACGYSQVPGVDFNDSFAPVVNDVSFRVLLIAKLVWKLKARIIDVETAFLHGDLKEEIFMEIPPGMEASKDECLILKKTIYGLVQSARQFYVKLVDALKGCGFEGSPVDPCLWTRNSSSGIVMMAIYVDDFLTLGTDAAIDEVIELMKNYGFGLKVKNDLTDYLSCRIIQDIDQGKAWIMQPHLI